MQHLWVVERANAKSKRSECMMNSEHTRDIVVIGTSAGGVHALPEVLRSVPADFPASIFVAMHLAPWHPSALPELINQRSALRARYPVHGDRFAPGSVYVAPPDNHLIVRDGYVHVLRGPKENGHRPSVDTLFRSASKTYGPRVIGVVLTGALDCGTAGLLGIKERGGLAIVQSPEDAEVPDMPMSALRHVEVDRVLSLSQIGPVLEKLVREPAPPWPAHQDPRLAQLEGDELGAGTEVVCPACNGRMTESYLRSFGIWRCHVGHSFIPTSLAFEQAEEVDRSLWAAVRALEDSASLARRLAGRSTGEMCERFLEREHNDTNNAAVLRRIALSPKLSHDRSRVEQEQLEGTRHHLDERDDQRSD